MPNDADGNPLMSDVLNAQGRGPIVVGGAKYGPREANALRMELIQMRSAALAQGSMDAAVVLSHTIGLFHELMMREWKEYRMLADAYARETRKKRSPKYGVDLPDLSSTIQNLASMQDMFSAAWAEFRENPTVETWGNLNEGAVRLRFVLDIASDYLVAQSLTADPGPGGAPS